MTTKLSSNNITQLIGRWGSADHRLRDIKLHFKKLVRNCEWHIFMGIIIIGILILSALTLCSLVSCYRYIGGTSCLNMKGDGSFRRSLSSAKLHVVITHTNVVWLFILNKSQYSSKISQFTILITPVIKYNLSTIILIQMFLLS